MSTTGDATTRLDFHRIREDFPILRQTVHGKPLVYLDSAATTQKPRCVLKAMSTFYTTDYANVHRGVYQLSERATAAYEEAREKVRRFLNARDSREIIFVRGTTEAINLVAQSYGGQNIRPGDEVVITHMEHHSNIVPWQILCERSGARLRVAPINDAGELILEEFEKLLGPKTRIVSLVHVSNALGTVNPVRPIIEMAHAKGIPVLLDGAQAAPRMPVDVQALNCDFYAISGHKMYGPSGAGVLYGKAELLDSMPPYQGGGEMIRLVTFEKTTYNDTPHKFEAGTPHIAGAVGMGAAIDYVTEIGLEAIEAHERQLLARTTESISAIPGLRIIGTAREKSGVVSFVVEGIHPHDLGTVLDHEGVALRAGHHCAQPLMERFSVSATARVSFGVYNVSEDIDVLVAGLHKARKVFA